MRVIECDNSHSGPVLAIFNDAITTSTALYDYSPRTPQMMDRWFQSKRQGGFPIIGIESDVGQLMGFASYGTFRAWPAYKYTVEHSLYVARPFRRQGLGTKLLHELIERAVLQNYHAMIGVIDSDNAASIELHRQMGFKYAGTLQQVGFKFGRWLDVALYQRTFDTPASPTDG